MTQLDTCRYCGTQGEAEPDLDPAPGVCPACLDKRLAKVTFEAVFVSELKSPAELSAWMRQQLLAIGMVEPWASRFVEGETGPTKAAIAEVDRRERQRGGR